MTEADTKYTSTDIFETEPCFLQNNSGNIAPGFNEHFGAFCLELKEKYNLPFSIYACIVEDIIKLFDNNQFTATSCFHDIARQGKCLSTKYGYIKHCKSVGLVAPITINVENDSYQYVSILDSLCAYFGHLDVFEKFTKIFSHPLLQS